MAERIIIAPGANESEILRSLASHGVSTFGLRILSPVQFARYILMHEGISVPEEYLNGHEAAAVIDTFIRETEYFKSASYADSKNVAEAIRTIRMSLVEREYEVIHEDFLACEFPDKNKALAEVYDRYMAYCTEHGRVDEVSLLRKAVACRTAIGEAGAIALREYSLTPLERMLVSGTGESTALSDLYGLDEGDIGATYGREAKIDYVCSYGTANEVRFVFDNLAAQGIAYDKCVVAVTKPDIYARLFYEYSQNYGVDIAFGCGLPIGYSNPAQLLNGLLNWNTTGFNGIDALNYAIMSDAVDRKKLCEKIGAKDTADLQRAINIVGSLKLSFEALKQREHSDVETAADTDAAHCAELLAEELAHGYAYMVDKYSFIRKGKAGVLDRAAQTVIAEALREYNRFSVSDKIEDVIPEILGRMICAEAAREGALYVTGISGALGPVREKLYVLGLSASYFPGNPAENYLLLDSDSALLERCGRKQGAAFEDEHEVLPASWRRIEIKKSALRRLIRLSNALDTPVTLTYSCYNAAEIRRENPSAVLFDIYRSTYGLEASTAQFEASMRRTGFFDTAMEGVYPSVLKFDMSEVDLEACSGSLKMRAEGYSPSALEEFFECRHKFFLHHVMGIKQKEEDDPFTVIDPRDFGTYIHGLMEGLALNPTMSREEFLAKAEAAFDRHLEGRPALYISRALRERNRFMNVAANAYDMDPKNEVMSAEEKKTVEHDCGVHLYGYPDRVEIDKDGNYLIADFKTGNKIKHKENDIDTCLQVVIYAYMMEKLGVPVKYCEYRYSRVKQTVRCVYDEAMKEKLAGKLSEVKQAFETGAFEPVEKKKQKDICKYCKYGSICLKGATD